MIAEMEAGGEGVAAFCRRHRLHPPTLQWWRWKLRAAGEGSALVVRRPPAAPTRFAEIRVGKSPVVDPPGEGFELRWSDGLSLLIPRQFDAGALGRLLVVLEAAGC